MLWRFARSVVVVVVVVVVFCRAVHPSPAWI
jgi:hypothetical protein